MTGGFTEVTNQIIDGGLGGIERQFLIIYGLRNGELRPFIFYERAELFRILGNFNFKFMNVRFVCNNHDFLQNIPETSELL